VSWISFLGRNSLEYPEKIAIIEQGTGQSLTYRELETQVDQWTYWLENLGVKKGDRVAYLSCNSKEHLLLLFACARLGAILNPMNFRLSEGELRHQVAFSTPKVIITHKEFDGIFQRSFLIDDIKLGNVTKTDLSNNDHAVLMLFTSGSTGEPKGVLFHGKMLETNIQMTCKMWNLVPSDITMVETPFFHTGGYNVLCLPLLWLGGTAILAEKFDPQNVVDTWKNEKVSVYFGVPTMFQNIYSHGVKEENTNSLRFCVSGGAAIAKETILGYQLLGIMFKQGFGLTEVGPNCFVLEEDKALLKLGSIGRPMPHSVVKVVDGEGNKVGTCQPGELLIKGDHLCQGYFQKEELFKNSLDEEGYFKTGDLVQFDEDGYFYVVGRIKDMYISGGENVYPGEVEKVLRDHPGIDEAVIVARPHEKWGEVGKMYYSAHQEIELDELNEWLKGKLAKYKWPKHLEKLDEFPLLPNGKINRVQLKEGALK
jgi:fatty-acyl-CoA synthase